MDNIFIEEKLLPRLTFNPGLAFEQPGPESYRVHYNTVSIFGLDLRK